MSALCVLCCAVFAPVFELHDIKQTAPLDITTRWTMTMKVGVFGWWCVMMRAPVLLCCAVVFNERAPSPLFAMAGWFCKTIVCAAITHFCFALSA